jgi:hypothetical protein
VERHRREALFDPSEFVALVKDNEQVHIATRRENNSAMRAKGNYEAAGISLIAWDKLSGPTRAELWRLMLLGRVANAGRYRPAAACGREKLARPPVVPVALRAQD